MLHTGARAICKCCVSHLLTYLIESCHPVSFGELQFPDSIPDIWLCLCLAIPENQTRTHTLGPHTAEDFFLFDIGLVFQSVKLTNERYPLWIDVFHEYIISFMNMLIGSITPLRPVAISKQLEWIGRSAYILACSIATALHSDINQTAGSGGYLNMWENRCMRATVCLLRAGRPTHASDAAKSGQFIGQLSWVTGDPIGLKGLINNLLSDADW